MTNQINLETATVTAIQLFIDRSEFNEHKDYSANIIVNDRLVIQLSGNDEECHPAAIPDSNGQYYNDEDCQDWAFENLDLDEVNDFLEREGIENNLGFLEDNGEEI